MKVVINRRIGGFGLSEKAVMACIALGMTEGENEGDCFRPYKSERDPSGIRHYCPRQDEPAFRCDPRVVQVVERLGKEADGHMAELEIVEIPFETPEGWHIASSDEGCEWVAENHRTWL